SNATRAKIRSELLCRHKTGCILVTQLSGQFRLRRSGQTVSTPDVFGKIQSNGLGVTLGDKFLEVEIRTVDVISTIFLNQIGPNAQSGPFDPIATPIGKNIVSPVTRVT